jgi:NAD(P)-dependent dehydrogenase (short-subunit alcohol dehydrogenase family)
MKLSHQKAAVITGGAKGFGLALAKRLAQHGVRVVLGDVDEAAGQQAIKDFDQL